MVNNEITQMVSALNYLHEETSVIFNSMGTEPAKNSRAEIELTKNKEVEHAFIQANLLIEGAADHLHALVMLMDISKPISTIAPWTCVRGAMEAGALASWFLDTNIDEWERIKRSFAFRYEGLSQQVKIVRASEDHAMVKTLNDRINKVEQNSLDLGYVPVLNKNGKRIGIGQYMPGITEIIHTAFNYEIAYRLISALAHAHPWAYQSASYKVVHKIIGNEKHFYLEKDIEPISIPLMCWIASKSFTLPVWNKFELYGWDSGNLRKIFDKVFSSLGSSWSSTYERNGFV